MSKEDPIEAYLRDFEAHLRVHGLRRRRIVGEVRSHLCQSARSLQGDRPAPDQGAAEEAIARFGGARALAAQFERLPRGQRVVAQRLVLLWTAWIAAMAMGSATVWAAVDWPVTEGTEAAAVIGGPGSSHATRWSLDPCERTLRSGTFPCP